MFVAETALYVALVCGERRKAEDRVICFSSASRNLVLKGEARDVAYFHPARTFEQIIKDDFASIPGVEFVNIDREGGEIIVRVGVNDPPQELRYRIYDKQSYLAHVFPELIFDFSLMPAE